MRWIKGLAVVGAILGVGAVVARWLNGPAFDPTRPRHDWGTASLTIDEGQAG